MAQKLKNSVVNVFGFGESGFTLMVMFTLNYIAFYLTDVAMISAAAVGIILLVARIGDGLSVAIAGLVLEKVHLKWGKYRSWLVIAPWITATMFILLYSNFGSINPSLKAVILGTIYVFAHFSLNLAWTAQTALIPVMATDPTDRVKLSSRRVQGTNVANIVLGLIGMPLVMALGSGNQGRGFFLTMIFFAVLQLAGYAILSRTVKQFDDGNKLKVDGAPRATLGDMLKMVFSNRPLLIIFLSEMAINTARFSVYGLAVYYFKYVANNMLLLSVFFTAVAIGGLVGSIGGEVLARKLGKRTVYVSGLVIEVICLTGLYLFANNATAFIGFNTVVAFGSGMAGALTFALYADIADYSEWQTGKNAKGLIMALSALPIKIGVALSGGIIGFSLAAIGYVADAPATPELVKSIGLISTMIPAIFPAIAVVAMFFYDLNEKKLHDIKIDLQAREEVVA